MLSGFADVPDTASGDETVRVVEDNADDSTDGADVCVLIQEGETVSFTENQIDIRYMMANAFSNKYCDTLGTQKLRIACQPTPLLSCYLLQCALYLLLCNVSAEIATFFTIFKVYDVEKYSISNACCLLLLFLNVCLYGPCV